MPAKTGMKQSIKFPKLFIVLEMFVMQLITGEIIIPQPQRAIKTPIALSKLLEKLIALKLLKRAHKIIITIQFAKIIVGVLIIFNVFENMYEKILNMLKF